LLLREKIKIVLDDIRTIEMVFETTKNSIFLSNDWIVIRTYNDFIKYIDEYGVSNTLISFDHDLACYDDDNGNELTGKTAAEYVINYCLDNNEKFPDWYVHSDNTSGRENIISMVVNYMKNVENYDTSNIMYYHRGVVDNLPVY